MQRGGAGRVLIAALAWLAGALSVHAGTVLVLSQTSGQLTALDSTSLEVRGMLDLDKGPANLVISPDGRLAYVAHSDLGSISVVDLAQWQVGARLHVGGAPFGLAVSKAGKLYVGDWNRHDVHEVDAATGKVLRTTAIGKAPAHLALTPDGKRLLAVAREANTVTILDTATFDSQASLKVGRAPFALAIAPTGSHALVANAQEGSISDIDLKTQAVTATTRVGAMPYGVAFTADGGVALVTNQQSGSVEVLPQGASPPAAGASEPAPAPEPSIKVGGYPEGIAITPDGSTAYVANWFSDDVSVIAIATRKEIARIKLPGGPRAVAIVEGSVGK